jgi:hypothetical protein
LGHTMMNKLNILLIILVIFSAIFAFFPERLFQLTAGKLSCANETLFQSSTQGVELPQTNAINSSGTVNYFKEDFSQFKDNSKIIDEFDDLNDLAVNGSHGNMNLSPDNYSGDYALSVGILPDDTETPALSVKKNLPAPLDLTRWNATGFFSIWLNLQDRKGITGISLKIGDQNSNYREFQEIKNFQLDTPNNNDSDDVYPDVNLGGSNEKPSIWTDFWLNKGWNYLFWKSDREHYTDKGVLDLQNISWYEITLKTDKNLQPQTILLDDLRIQDGVLKSINSLDGQWYPPDNQAQNGIYELNKSSDNQYFVKLFNIRHSQYPGNGDHGRMVLSYNTPLNFSLKTKFRLSNFPKNDQEKMNTLFRVAYDFDSSFEPGHDWFGAFISFEWNKFGLTTVMPIEKGTVQEWEPKKERIAGASTDFIPQENKLYQLDLTVRGQNAEASIYELNNNCAVLKAKKAYEFQRPRHGDDQRYPFCLEVTGNVKAEIYDLEIKEL